jgi:hypothetical protein
MNIKRVVDMKADSVYVGYRGFEFNSGTDQINIDMTDSQMETFAQELANKVARTKARRLAELKKELEEAIANEDDT